MSQGGSNALIQQLLAAEEEADKIVKRARENRVRKLKDAMVAAEEEIKIFKEKEEKLFQEEFEKRYGATDTSKNDLEEVTKKEIELVKRDYKANKDTVINFLMKTTTAVELKLDAVQKRFLTEKGAAEAVA